MRLPALTRDCLSEDEVVELVEGRLGATRLSSVERHLSSCDDCARLVGEVARSTSGDAPGSLREDEGAPLARDTRVGRYVVLSVLGEGAMGRVYAARDPELDRTVALKVLHSRIVGPELEARLKREAKAMARLTHPEVIAVYDAGRHGAQLFIAMELVDGGTLRQWLATSERPWREVLGAFMRAGRGLAQAHAAGLVHRDFKPDKVLVGKDVRVRVTDFGLARAIESVDALAETADAGSERNPTSPAQEGMLTRTGTLVGTPAYMAPEQLRGGSADARSDVYAFSVSLYEGLYGERPFDGATFAALEAAKREGRVKPPPPERAIPPRLRRAILVGLCTRPEDRYASMDACLDALALAARPPRTPWIAAGAIALGAAGVALSFVIGSPARSRASRGAPLTGSTMSPAPAACSPSACTAARGGEPSRCRPRDGACVPILSEDCAPRFEPADARLDDTVWIGAMFPLKGPSAAAWGTTSADGADFARKEIADATRALEASSASKHVRRVALVMCDDATDPERAARHLVDDLGVPAILGFKSGQELVDLAGSLLVPSGVVSVATLTSSPLITRVPQSSDLPRMVWRTTYGTDAAALATARIVTDILEPRVAAPGKEVRITVARSAAATNLWFAESFYRHLVLNGKSANANGDAYQEIATPTLTASQSEIEALAERVVATHPDLVVLTGNTKVTTPLVAAVEARSPKTRRPIYTVANDSAEPLAAFAGADADRRRRVFSITSASDDTTNARFVIRYNTTHAAQVTLTFNPSSSYDAFYLLAYGTFALGDAPATGAAIARSFERLVPPGRRVEVGPGQIFDALSDLGENRRIDLHGAAGPLDFDLANGESPVDFALLCLDVDASTPPRARGERESGVYYRATSRAVAGKLRCP